MCAKQNESDIAGTSRATASSSTRRKKRQTGLDVRAGIEAFEAQLKQLREAELRERDLPGRLKRIIRERVIVQSAIAMLKTVAKKAPPRIVMALTALQYMCEHPKVTFSEALKVCYQNLTIKQVSDVMESIHACVTKEQLMVLFGSTQTPLQDAPVSDQLFQWLNGSQSHGASVVRSTARGPISQQHVVPRQPVPPAEPASSSGRDNRVFRREEQVSSQRFSTVPKAVTASHEVGLVSEGVAQWLNAGRDEQSHMLSRSTRRLVSQKPTSVSRFTHEQQRIYQELKGYINRIDRIIGESRDFGCGFTFFKNWQGEGRKANYALARRLVERLESGNESFNQVFSGGLAGMETLRERLVQDLGFRPITASQITSSELKRVIEEALDLVERNQNRNQSGPGRT